MLQVLTPLHFLWRGGLSKPSPCHILQSSSKYDTENIRYGNPLTYIILTHGNRFCFLILTCKWSATSEAAACAIFKVFVIWPNPGWNSERGLICKYTLAWYIHSLERLYQYICRNHQLDNFTCWIVAANICDNVSNLIHLLLAVSSVALSVRTCAE